MKQRTLNESFMRLNPRLFLTLIVIFIFINVSFSQTDSTPQDSINKTKKIYKKDKKAEKKRLDREYIEGRRWRISSSFINASFDSYIQFMDLNGVLGVKLSLENLLRFEKKSVIPKLDFQYSFNRRSSLYAEYYNIARSSSHNIDEDFDWGDIEVPEDIGVVDLFLNTRIWSLGYMYSFVNKPHAELSFFANIYLLEVETGLDVKRPNIRSRFSITAPLPSIGYRFSFEILPKVRFGGTGSLFFLQIGEYGGNISNIKLNLDYRALKWLSTGISYSKFDLNINAQAKYFQGKIEYTYQGPGLYLQFMF